MSTTISIAAARTARDAELTAAPSPVRRAEPVAPGADTLVGLQLGSIERRYGFMASVEAVCIEEVISVSGDLAVAERIAYMAAAPRDTAVVVIQVEGSFVAARTDSSASATQLLELMFDNTGGPHLMSVVSGRGIMPALGPLVA